MLATARALRDSRVFKKLGTVKAALEKFDSDMKLHHYRVRDYRPNVVVQFERGDFVVKTAADGYELAECLKLRFEVFHKEYMNKRRTHGVDVDHLDFDCDHLVIYNKRIGRTIGTYRLNSSLFTDTFYSAGEFEMGRLLEMDGHKLELGRACIDREFRTGVVIALLWRGIAEYIQRTETKVLFGCGSIKTIVPLEIGLLTKHFIDQGVLTQEFEVEPTKKYKVKSLGRVLDYLESNPFEYNREVIEKQVPALFNSYLRMGAKLCGEPAIDREFHCIDFLTCLKLDELHPLLKGKYKV